MAQSENDRAYEERVRLLTEAVEEYQVYLVNYAFGYAKNWQDAENIVQELWKYVIVYYETQHLKVLPMLRRKTYQLFIDQYRSKQRKPLEFLDEFSEEKTLWKDQDSVGSVDEEEMKKEFYGQFKDLELTEQQRDVFWLHARYGYTFAEISKVTGKATSTVGDWVSVARRKLAEKLSEEN